MKRCERCGRYDVGLHCGECGGYLVDEDEYDVKSKITIRTVYTPKSAFGKVVLAILTLVIIAFCFFVTGSAFFN